MSDRGITKTNIPGLKLANRGKVRDIYDLGAELLIVATDRISCFDVVLPTPIPGKGAVLTQLANFWFSKTSHIVDNHLSENSLKDIIADRASYDRLKEQAVLVKKCRPLPIESIVRGYISGSGWKDYQTSGRICGLKLPTGLSESEKLPEVLYTP
ncbi:MAG: phosphoribosylaminoimidazolesuccinocarboxamide synthase, partial [bacterium]